MELNYITLLTLIRFNINLRSRSEELNYITLLILSIINISLCSRSEVLNYFLGLSSVCSISVYVQDLRCWTIYSACPQNIQYQPTFKICCTKLFTRLALFIFNINLRSSSDVLNYKHLLTFSIFNISLRSRSEVLNYIPLLTPKIFNISLRSRFGKYTKLFRLISVYSISTYVQVLKN